jgi:hypothetical protein
MRTNWKNKYESLVKINNATLLDNTAKQVIISNLKGQLTRLRKKSVEALELAKLLQWAKKKELIISGYGDGTFEVEELNENQAMSTLSIIAREKSRFMIIPTLEGDMRLDQFNWLVKGIKGEFYPVEKEIFEALYDAVEDIDE